MAGERGIGGVAVEPLARRVGATKGSFYWHFNDLPTFVRALLDHWRETQTTQVMARIDALPAHDRLLALLRHSVAPGSAATTLAIMAAAGQPEVGPVVREVQHQRVSYLERLFTDRGLPRAQARARARISYSAYLGNLVMSSTGPKRGGRAAMQRDLTELLQMLES